MSHVQELNEWCNSWVVTRKATGEVIGEFWNCKNVERFDPAKCLIETTSDYLSRINKEIEAANDR